MAASSGCHPARPGIPTEHPSAQRIVVRDPRQRAAIVQGTSIGVDRLLADIEACAASVPNDARHVIDPGQQRYEFIVRFLAVLHRGLVNLLPTRRDPETYAAAQAAFPNTVVADGASWSSDATARHQRAGTFAGPSDLDRGAVVAFTSGTTGAPRAHPKSWRMLDAFRHVHARYLRHWLAEAGDEEFGIVATVPPWHMYGLEWTLLLPTVAPAVLYCDDTFYPSDVRAALDQFDMPTLLVTTPTHLRALLKTPPPARPVAVTMCATSPLDAELAAFAEAHLKTTVIDLYGCTEIGSLATRRPTASGNDRDWGFFDCFDLHLKGDALTVDAEVLDTPVTLADRFAACGDGRYRLVGRTADIVKVGGKRESLANLNALLLRIPGVQDGVVYDPSALGLRSTGRLAALVVAPGLDAQTVRRKLAADIDSVFIPRPIRLVDALPREATSKLTATALRKLLAKASNS